MLFNSVTCIFALLFLAKAAPSFHDWSNRCKDNTLKQYDIANETEIDIGADPLIPFSSAKLSAVNQTAWEFWFFDSTTVDGDAGISFAFWRDNSHVGIDNPPLGVLRLQTQVSKTGHRYSFKTSTDLKYTTIILESPTLNGTYTLSATAPGVYADENLWPSRRATAKVMPYAYWDASVPSGKVTVDFNVAGTPLKFTGIGGHDRNWTSFPLVQAALGWQESRVNAGPYTVIFWLIGSQLNGKTYLASVVIKSNKVIFTSKQYTAAKNTDYMLFSQTHVNNTSIPFDPTKARTTFNLDFVSASKNKKWKFAVDFADPEWAINDRGFGGIIPASVTGGEVGRKQYSGVGTAIHAEFALSWVYFDGCLLATGALVMIVPKSNLFHSLARDLDLLGRWVFE